MSPLVSLLSAVSTVAAAGAGAGDQSSGNQGTLDSLPALVASLVQLRSWPDPTIQESAVIYKIQCFSVSLL